MPTIDEMRCKIVKFCETKKSCNECEIDCLSFNGYCTSDNGVLHEVRITERYAVITMLEAGAKYDNLVKRINEAKEHLQSKIDNCYVGSGFQNGSVVAYENCLNILEELTQEREVEE